MEERMHTEAIALSHEKNPSQLMLPFIEGDYWYYNKAETESLQQKLAIDQRIKEYLSI